MTDILQFVNLTRHFDRSHHFIQASGSLNEGDILAVQGPSGSGKSTLLKMLARLLAPDEGQMLYRSLDYRAVSPLEWRRKIQYLSQKPVIFDGSVEANLRLPFSLAVISRDLSYDQAKAGEYMQLLGLSTEMFSQEAQTLSGGEAARIALIRALLIDPEILLLDEPTAYLDETSRKRLFMVLQSWLHNRPGRAMVIVSHQQEDIYELPGVSVLNLTGMSDEGMVLE